MGASGELEGRKASKQDAGDSNIYMSSPISFQLSRAEGRVARAESPGESSLDLAAQVGRPGRPEVNRKQRQLILYLFRNRDSRDKPSIYMELNWNSQAVTMVAKALQRKGLICQVSEEPPEYELTEKCKHIVNSLRGRGY